MSDFWQKQVLLVVYKWKCCHWCYWQVKLLTLMAVGKYRCFRQCVTVLSKASRGFAISIC